MIRTGLLQRFILRTHFGWLSMMMHTHFFPTWLQRTFSLSCLLLQSNLILSTSHISRNLHFGSMLMRRRRRERDGAWMTHDHEEFVKKQKQHSDGTSHAPFISKMENIHMYCTAWWSKCCSDILCWWLLKFSVRSTSKLRSLTAWAKKLRCSLAVLYSWLLSVGAGRAWAALSKFKLN